MTSALAAIDSLLSKADADDMSWADGGDSEIADELLGQVQPGEWQTLLDLASQRPANWRRCLASALRPKQGGLAAQLLISLTNDADLEVAFEALLKVAAYCGVNDSAKKETFIDSSIRDPDLLALAMASTFLPQAIQRISSQCSSHFSQRFQLLAQQISLTASDEVATALGPPP